MVGDIHTRRVRRAVRKAGRAARVAVALARALADGDHPLMAHIVPTRRCNLACAYCNEYDAVSQPGPGG